MMHYVHVNPNATDSVQKIDGSIEEKENYQVKNKIFNLKIVNSIYSITAVLLSHNCLKLDRIK